MKQSDLLQETTTTLQALISANDEDGRKILNFLLSDIDRKDAKIKKMISDSKKKERGQNATDKRLFTKVFQESLLALVQSGKLSFADYGFMLGCTALLSKTGNALINPETETIIRTISELAKALKKSPRTIEARIKSLDESRIGILTRTRDGFFLEIEQKYFTRQAPKSIPLTEEEQWEVEQIYEEMM